MLCSAELTCKLSTEKVSLDVVYCSNAFHNFTSTNMLNRCAYKLAGLNWATRFPSNSLNQMLWTQSKTNTELQKI